jgi:hypothetical protein
MFPVYAELWVKSTLCRSQAVCQASGFEQRYRGAGNSLPAWKTDVDPGYALEWVAAQWGVDNL